MYYFAIYSELFIMLSFDNYFWFYIGNKTFLTFNFNYYLFLNKQIILFRLTYSVHSSFQQTMTEAILFFEIFLKQSPRVGSYPLAKIVNYIVWKIPFSGSKRTLLKWNIWLLSYVNLVGARSCTSSGMVGVESEEGTNKPDTSCTVWTLGDILSNLNGTSYNNIIFCRNGKSHRSTLFIICA